MTGSKITWVGSAGLWVDAEWSFNAAFYRRFNLENISFWYDSRYADYYEAICIK